VKLLLDTHALLWWLAGDRRLSKRARALIGDEANEIYVSAASAWEVATKHRIGRLPDAGDLVADFAGQVADQGFVSLPITLEHAQRAGSLAGSHRDPFDRMLIAQGHAENLTLISIEEVFDRYGVTRVW
jgi:PIN domain nuclease of toxin-antitoxin system